jgi:subtilisin family serine protease
MRGAGLRVLVAAVAVLATVAVGMAAAQPEREPAADEIQPKLLQTLQDKDAAPFWVRFEDRADLAAASRIEDWEARGRAVHAALTRTAKASQVSARALLEATGVEYTPFWVSNAIYVHRGSLELAETLAADREVSDLLAPASYRIPEPAKVAQEAEVDSVEWNVAAIGADDVWSEFGTGDGIVVASIDTGAQHTHPALIGRYRGNTGDGFDHDYNWYDPSRVCPSSAPCDNNRHGTHTIGTMVGDDGAGNQIGVAPGAKWIAAKGCETASCSGFALVSSGQWMLAPTDLAGQNPRPDLRPHVVNNSWSLNNREAENPFYDDILAAWRAAGVFPAFANGNAGPSCDTAGSPGDSLASYSVGAYDINGNIASFSSRGPGADGELKPNVSAPGVAVRSSVLNGGYAALNGTSMATPHVAATVALIWSGAPALTGDVGGTEALLDQTAGDAADTGCGGTGSDNNVYGEGRLDAQAAARAAGAGPAGTLRGTVTDAATGVPIASGRVTAVSGGSTRLARTADDGAYTIRALPGEYRLTATAFGYVDGSVTATVAAGENATIDLALEPAPVRVVQGEVVEQGTDKAVPGATVTLVGTPLSTTSDTEGRYQFGRVPVGDYTIAVAPAATDFCFQAADYDVSVREDTVRRLEVGHVRDPFGHTCTFEPAEYIDADDDPILFEPDTDPTTLNDVQTARIALPFSIDLYERSYSPPRRSLIVTDNGSVHLSEGGLTGTVYPWYSSQLTFVEGSQVATALRGTAPNRTFTVEWRNIAFELDHSVSLDFEVTLHEDGDIVFAYGDALQLGGAHVGLVPPSQLGDNAAFSLSRISRPPVTKDRQVRITAPPSGIGTGRVVDANDGQPVADTPIRITDGTGRQVRHHLLTDADGHYRSRVPPGDYDVTIGGHGYVPQSTAVRIERGQIEVVDAALRTGVLLASPDTVHVAVDGSGNGATDLGLMNTGAADLTWRAAEIGERPAAAPAGERLDAWTLPPNAPFMANGTAETPDGHLWLSGLEVVDGRAAWTIRKFRPDGSPTGTVHEPLPTLGRPDMVLSDLAYVRRSDLLCSAARPFDATGVATIVCIDPATGALEQPIEVLGLPDGSFASGIAYDEANDVFYVVGGNSEPLFTGYTAAVGGFGYQTPGRVLSTCRVDYQLAGAAYHPTSRTLWAGGDANPYTEAFFNRSVGPGIGNRINQFDPRTCEVVSRFRQDRTPEIAPTWATGLDVDSSGNLWATSGNLFSAEYNGVLRYGSGDPIEVDADGLSVSATSGALAPGARTSITIDADLPAGAGNRSATLRLMTDAGREWDVRVPVFLHTFGGLRGLLDDLVDAGEVRRGKERTLHHGVDRAELLSARGNDPAANAQLRTFENQVDAFAPRDIDPEAAERLTTEATYLRQG